LHTLFAEQVPQRPRQPAVIACGRTLTYQELDRRALGLARWLRSSGAGANRLVAVVMDKGWEEVVAVLAILRAGAAYLPISASLPQERIRHLLEAAEVELVLTQSWVEERLEWPPGLDRRCVDREEPTTEDEPPLELAQSPEDLAYVIYTSGSTGLPKGVMIDHRGAVNTILDVNRRFAVGPGDRVLALSSLGFDLSVYDVFGTLAAGGTIVVPDAAATRDPAHWAELIHEHGVSVWNSVPALMEMLVAYVEKRPDVRPRSLRLVLMSGDWIAVTLPERIKAVSDGVEVISLGGATEASIWSILYPIAEVDPEWTSIPYGRAMVHQRLYVLNHALEHCPVWVRGQIHIAGIGLAKGYWGDEEQTRA
ncbi:MAG: amino acid adenylation domain-containing protein, partial [bacterium]|nr:amino acid adenylation domain-containing protein [bacterium]